MKKATWIFVIIAVFAIACCPAGYGLTDRDVELSPRVQVLSGEINQIDQAITQKRQEILQLQAERIRRVGALEELDRVQGIIDRNKALEDHAKASLVEEVVAEVPEETLDKQKE